MPSQDIVSFLCCALADDADRHRAELPALWRRVGDDAAWRHATENRVPSVVGLALRAALPPSELPPRWCEAIGRTESRLRLVLSELDRIAAHLAREGIRVVALKNAGIARGIYPWPAGCPMGDVDLLVHPDRFRDADAVMRQIGYALDSRSPLGESTLEEMEAAGGAEYRAPLADGSPLWVELQWRPVAGRWVRPDQEPSAGLLLERSHPVAGTDVRLLAPEDNLLQVCLHTAKHSFVRAPGFRIHTDADRIVRRREIDWDRLLGHARELRVLTPVHLSLRIPAMYLRTPVPEEVLHASDPFPLKTRFQMSWIRKAGLFGPDRRKWSRPGYILFNMLLYDSARGILRALFPPATWMRAHYRCRSTPSLLYRYAERLVSLLLRRAAT